ncbi:hypothetical protein FACS189456_7580 [Bacteroidia bacterium]|nr:hypothetical protein FACS189456_7580 [Bacteroidia bacterium]
MTNIASTHSFTNLVDAMYSLPIDERVELKTLLECSIADIRRDEILENYRQAQAENSAGALQFSGNIETLKKML